VRTVFRRLALANAAFFAWTRLVAPGGAGADPAPLARQISPEKMRVVRPEELAQPSPTKNVAASPAPVTTASTLPNATVPPPAPPPPPSALPARAELKCIEWGAFAPAEAARAETALAPLALGERLSRHRTEETAGWWVFIPPPARGNNARQAAVRKAGELKKLGIQDYFVVQEEGPNHWAVSLGVFRSEEAAQARLAALRSQGVRSARMGPRDTQVAKVWLQVKSVDAPLETRLRELAQQAEGTELRECAP
jgi:hypothetical protein